MEIDPVAATIIAVIAAIAVLAWLTRPRRRRIPLGLVQLGEHLIATTRKAQRRPH